jgi:hypothetical protein
VHGLAMLEPKVLTFAFDFERSLAAWLEAGPKLHPLEAPFRVLNTRAHFVSSRQ